MRERLPLTIITIIFFLFAVLVLWNFLLPIIAACVLTYLFYPVYKFFTKKLSPIISSFITVLLVFLLILVPAALLTTALINQASMLRGIFSFGVVESIGDKFGFDISDLSSDIAIKLGNALKDWIPNVFSAITESIIALFVMLFVMFYLFIDGKKILEWAKYLPLSPKNKAKLFSEMEQVTSALMVGQVLTALAQGIAGTIGFLIFGIPGAIVWGFVMAILSFIPLVGTYLVWVPAGLILILQQEYFRGIGILVWGFLIIGSIDNILRPKLVSQRADIHPALVFLGVLGGLHWFGIIGVVIGPMVLALFPLFLKMILHKQ